MKKTNYKERFEQLVNQDNRIADKDGNILLVNNIEEFQQCYKEDDAVRKDFPKYWFVSKKGDVISAYGKKLLWLKKDFDQQGRAAYHYKKDGKIKIIKSYVLAGLVFGAYRFGKADKLIMDKSVYAFGNKKSLDNVNMHHTLRRENYLDSWDDDASVNEFVTVQVHNLLDKAQDVDVSTQSQIEYMKEFSRIAEEEAPGQIVVLAPGEVWNKKTGEMTNDGRSVIVSLADTGVGITFLKEAAEQLQQIREQIIIEMVRRQNEEPGPLTENEAPDTELYDDIGA